MALSDSERDRIVELRLEGMSIRDVMNSTGHASATVSKVWHLYLAETAQDRRADLGLRREELLQRFERNAQEARCGAVVALDAEDHGAAARYLAAELAALRRIVELEGLLDTRAPDYLTPTATAEDPLPWRPPAEALAYRVAYRHADRERDAATASVYNFAELPVPATPTVAELLPVAVEAVESTLAE